MLPSLISQVAIFLHPKYVAAVRYSVVLHKKVTHQSVIEIDTTGDGSIMTVIIKAVTGLLSQAAFKGCHTEIILSGHFTKHRVVKWKDGLSEQDLKAILSHQFSELYGLKENTFDVLISDQGYRKNALAFTVDSALHAAINNWAQKKQIQLTAIQPNFAWMLNYWRRSLNENAWILIKEDLFFHIAKIIENNWVVLKTFPIKDQEMTELIKSFSRELLHQGMEDDFKVYMNIKAIHEKTFKSVLHPKQTLVLLQNDQLLDLAPNLSFAAYRH